MTLVSSPCFLNWASAGNGISVLFHMSIPIPIVSVSHLWLILGIENRLCMCMFLPSTRHFQVLPPTVLIYYVPMYWSGKNRYLNCIASEAETSRAIKIAGSFRTDLGQVRSGVNATRSSFWWDSASDWTYRKQSKHVQSFLNLVDKTARFWFGVMDGSWSPCAIEIFIREL